MLAQDSTGSTFLWPLALLSVCLSVAPGPGGCAVGGPVMGTLARGEGVAVNSEEEGF